MSTNPRDNGEAGQPGSIIPGGRGHDVSQPAAEHLEEDYSIGDRVGRDPSNLGDEIRDGGDLVHPAPEPSANNL